MPNYNKSFNFRNGVQVDEDDLIVRSSLVGIGTTIPRSELDVYGDTKVSGIVTTNKLYVTGVSTFSDVHVGAGVTIYSATGIISATNFYGDGSKLVNLPTSQWVDINESGIGVTSIYAIGNVGIGTTDPTGTTLQVGGDPNDSKSGVGIGSDGTIIASGIITATGGFSGDGSQITNLNANNITSGSLSENFVPENLHVAGVITAISGDFTNLTVTGVSTLGVVTATTLGIDSLHVAGVSTFNNDVEFIGPTAGISSVTWDKSEKTFSFKDNVKATFGNTSGSPDLSIYHTTASGGYSAISDTGTGGLVLGSNALSIKNAALDEKQAVFTENGAVDLYYDDTLRIKTTGIGVTVYDELETTRLSIAGVSTFQDNVNIGKDLVVTGLTTAGFVTTRNFYASGIATIATANIGTLNVTGIGTIADLSLGNLRLAKAGTNEIDTSAGNLILDSHGGLVSVDDNLSVTGVATFASTTTFTGQIDANGGATIDNVRIGVADDNTIDTSSGDLKLSSNSSTVNVTDNFKVSGISTGEALYGKNISLSGVSTAQSGVWGNNVRLGISGASEIDTSSGNLTIDSAGGTVAVDDNLTVSGDTTFTGAVTANGSVDLGDSSSDSVTFTARVDSSIVPDADNVRDLGDTSRQWRDLYLTGLADLDYVNVSSASTFASSVTFNTGIIPDADVGAYLGQSGSAFSEAHIDGITIGAAGTTTITTRGGDLRLDAASGKVVVPNDLSVVGYVTFTNGIAFRDESKVTFGGNNSGITSDLSIYHTAASGGYSAIVDSGSGGLVLGSNVLSIKNPALSSTQADFWADDRVDLYYNNLLRFSTSGVGVTITDQLDVNNINVSAGGTFGNVTVDNIRLDGNEVDTTSGNLTLDSTGGTVSVDDNLTVIERFTSNKESFLTGNVYAGTDLNDFFVGGGKVGIGTTVATNEFEVVKDSGDLVAEFVSRTGNVTIGLGQSIGIGNSSATVAYSGKNLEFTNKTDDGDVNVNLAAGAAGSGIVTSSSFNVKYDNAPIISVGYSGGVGVNKADPVHALDVVGSLAVSQHAKVVGVLTVGTGVNEVTFGTGSGFNITGDLTGNVNATSGVSTFYDLYVSNSVGIGTTNPAGADLYVGDISNTSLYVTGERVAIGTNTPTSDVTIDGNTNIVGDLLLDKLEATVGIGTTQLLIDSRRTFITGISTAGTIGITTNLITGITTAGIGPIIVDDEPVRVWDIEPVDNLIPFGTRIVGIGTEALIMSNDSLNVAITTSVLGLGTYTGDSPSFSYGQHQVFGDVGFIGNQLPSDANISHRVVFSPWFGDNNLAKPHVGYAGTGIGTSYYTGTLVGINTLNPRSSLDVSGSKGFIIPPIHNWNTRSISTESYSPLNDSDFINDISGDANPTVVNGSISFYEPRNRLEVGITTYDKNLNAAEWDNIRGMDVLATVGVTTTILTGINTTGLYVGMEVKQEANVIRYNTKIVSIGTSTVTIDRASLNSGVGTDTLSFGRYQYPASTIFKGIPLLESNGSGEWDGVGIGSQFVHYDAFVPPRWTTTQRDALTTYPYVLPTGSIIYNTEDARLEYYGSGGWDILGSGAGGGGGGAGIKIYDTGSLVGVSSIVNFGTGLDVTPLSVGVVTITGSGISNVVEDTTPQLGGQLDLNGKYIAGTGGVNVTGIITATNLHAGNHGLKSGSGSFTAQAGIAHTVDSFPHATENYKTAEYTVHITNGSSIQSQKILVMQDQSVAYYQEFAVMYNNNLLVSVGATISGANCVLKVTPETGISGSTNYRFTRGTLL